MAYTSMIRPCHILGMLLLVSLMLTLLPCTVGADTCKKINSCKCKFDNGSVIDLIDLANNDGTARFQDVIDPAGHYYSYNPCEPFSDGSGSNCKDVAACQKTILEYYSLGTQDSATFTTNEDKVVIQYSEAEAERFSYFTLVCTPAGTKDELEFVTESPEMHYKFNLKSKSCCPTEGGGGGLSAGTILCIIFIVLVTLYIVVGILYMKFVREAEGTDLIPNKMFWISLPGLIKDGVLFVLRPCRKGSTPYDEI